MVSSAYKTTITGSERPTWQWCLYSQRCRGSHFMWLSGPHSDSAPSLINQDAYPLMHRDEQSVWQAGSYSFLTPASAEWCYRTAGPLPFLSLPCFPLSKSPLLCVPFLTLSSSLICSSLLFSAHSHSSLFSFLSLPPHPFLYSYSLAPSLSFPPRGPCFLACITHNYFHPSIICLLLFS